jgi:SH3-like domain-containing protein
MASTTLKIVVAVVIVLVAVVGVYAALTLPRDAVNFTVSFTVGVDSEQREFEMPFTHDKAQVSVSISSGSALWRATITDADGEEVWTHTVGQGDGQTYNSDWLSLPSGSYNFTFRTIGGGDLQANVRVTTKGGIW